jgi:triacylglycerol lipase
MTSGEPAEWILLGCGAAYQAVLQYLHRSSGFVIPHGYRVAASLGLGKDPYLGYVMESPSTVVVALRGTQNVFDLFTDFNWSQIPYLYAAGAGSVHRGFAELYERKLRPQLLACLGRLSPRKRLVLAGHSLGGALATLAAPDLARNTRFRPAHVLTYGSPMVGNALFAAAYDTIIDKSTQVMNVHDFVVRLPPSDGEVSYVPVKKRLAVSFRFASPFRNHDIRRYADALADRYPAAAARIRRRSPGFLP